MFKYLSGALAAGLIALGLLSSAPAVLAQSKISDLTALTGPNLATDDLFVIVDTSATATKKITADEMRRALGVPRIRLRVYRSSSLSIANNTTTDLTWDAEATDPSGIFTPGSTYVTVPADVTECSISASVYWTSNSSGARWHIWEQRNSSGTSIRILADDIRNAAFESPSHNFQDWFSCTPGDRLALMLRQGSGGALTVNGNTVFTYPQPTEAWFYFR